MEIDLLLSKMLQHDASDLYLVAGSEAIIRGDKMTRDGEVLTEENIRSIMAAISSLEDLTEFEEKKELNIAYADKDGNRFRINFFRQMQRSGMVIRHIKKIIPNIDTMGLPSVYKEAISQKRGLVLLAGHSGSGKSTSIAAMLDYYNRSFAGHIITVEDPIEFVHENKQSLFTQREVGIDTDSWQNALKNALRQRPDIIYIGEIRDAETMAQAIHFAETGHLCVATIHATSAAQTVERVANLFNANNKAQSLYSLAQVLKFIFAQRLVAGTKGKKELVTEILKNVGLIKPLVVKGAITEIQDLLQKNNDIGTMTFEQSLLSLYDAGKISRATAVEEADNPQNMELELLRRGAQRSHVAAEHKGSVR